MKAFFSSVLLGIGAAFTTVPVYAYLDPVSGGAILSAIIGAFVASVIFFKSLWYKIIRKIKKLFLSDKKSDDC